MHLVSLIKSRRFAPLFITQFLGAFNDNIYKNTLMLILAFHSADVLGLNTSLLMNLAAALFILPFFLFSALAGQIADKYEKSRLIKYVKFIEILIMLVAALCFIQQWYWLLLFLLFCMGAQSAFFGPLKYAILPQHLKQDELLGGNAWIEMGTFVAILLGTIGAGLIMESHNYLLVVSLSVVVFALLGFIGSLNIPKASATNSDLIIHLNPFKASLDIVHKAKRQPQLYTAIIAISWFWFLGAAYLTQFPTFAKSVLGGDTSLVTLLLACFSIGIGVGSMLCDKLTRSKIEPGIVVLGAIGLSVFGLDFVMAIPIQAHEVVTASAFLANTNHLRFLFDLLMIGVCGGVFIVPLYAYVQETAHESLRAQMIALINIMNAWYMVLSAVAGMVFLVVLKVTIAEFFIFLAILNTLMSVYI
ncbi:MAG: MFS transporter, partial [Phototrophicales bacterium]